MARNAMGVNLRQSIIKSFGRFFAIVLIIALGAALFVGLLMTKSDMVLTGQEYTDEKNMFDLRWVCTYGWSEEQVQKAAALPGIAEAEGITYADMITVPEGLEKASVHRFYAIPGKLNQITLIGGRMPENAQECLADSFFYGDESIGMQIRISSENDEDSLENMVYDTYTVVGYAASPLYMDMNRGTTTVGSGSLSGCFYLLPEAFDMDYYTELHLAIPGEHQLYTSAYHSLMESENDRLEAQAKALGMERFLQIKEEAMEEYRDGYNEYLDGLEEYREGNMEFQQEIADALKELEDGEAEIKESRRKLLVTEQQLKDAEIQLHAAERQLDSSEAQVNSQIAATQGMLAAIPGQITAAQGALNSLDPGSMSEEEYAAAYAELEAKLNGLYYQQSALQTALDVTLPGYLQQIEDQRNTVAYSWMEVNDGFGQVRYGWQELTKAEAEIADAWIEFEEGKAEGEQELADAKLELQDAQKELQDAWDEIQDLEKPDVYLLDRTSNIGYNSLDSTSDIVAGVSRVLPGFFLLVAALVCITTMTRMVDEERTQIGTLKALGYSNAAIMSKYLIYAGSGAVLGCGLGVAAGSVIFPRILWEAYKMMLCVREDIAISFNLWLCGIVVAVYTGVILFVTWNCCRKALKEVPAELIRPKAPDPGKKLLVEFLPLWRHVSFLNKVMIRNIFRYKQRLAMMLVGIGGCTALLVTGFGLQDSIVGVVDYQFTNVTPYDLEVYFNGHQPPLQQQKFTEELGDRAENIVFFHQSSVDLEFDGVTKEIYMIAAGEEITTCIRMNRGDEQISLPGYGEVVLTSGVAAALDIQAGDTVLLRNADMQTMELTVSGIYENHIYNYSIVSPQTLIGFWNEEPEQQMAYIQTADGVDIHALSAVVSEMDDVMNVSVSEDLAHMVSKMMQALDLVIVLVVFCAGLLATIVLYNLTNININERIREIATIKVLGFNAKETGAYVFKENMALTVVGSIFGLGLGQLLLMFVMSQIKIDMVWFKTVIDPTSFIYSVVLTLAASLIVDFLFYFKLDKINMAEALKSVE